MVTGGISAFKSIELARILRDLDCEVAPVVTRAALEFIGVQSLSSITGRRALTELFGDSPSPHTELADWADLIAVYPATADFLARMAHGMADDLALATLLAFGGPVVVAPAMHSQMWLAAPTRRAVELLVDSGVRVIGPDSGRLAGGDTGIGRLVEPAFMSLAVDYWTRPGAIDMRGRRILISAGGTREAIDSVRYLGNRSSGRQGFALAKVAVAAGAEVDLVTTVTPDFQHPGLNVVEVESALAMLDEMERLQAVADVTIMAAAVADFRAAAPLDGKIKREGLDRLELDLVANPDIVATLAKGRREGQTIVGFAAETERLAESVREKLYRKGLDMVVGNDVSQASSGFGSPSNSVYILDSSGNETFVELSSKEEVAIRIFRAVELLRSGRSSS